MGSNDAPGAAGEREAARRIYERMFQNIDTPCTGAAFDDLPASQREWYGRMARAALAAPPEYAARPKEAPQGDTAAGGGLVVEPATTSAPPSEPPGRDALREAAATLISHAGAQYRTHGDTYSVRSTDIDALRAALASAPAPGLTPLDEAPPVGVPFWVIEYGGPGSCFYIKRKEERFCPRVTTDIHAALWFKTQAEAAAFTPSQPEFRDAAFRVREHLIGPAPAPGLTPEQRETTCAVCGSDDPMKRRVRKGAMGGWRDPDLYDERKIVLRLSPSWVPPPGPPEVPWFCSYRFHDAAEGRAGEGA